MKEEQATCRGCGMLLKGGPYYKGGSTYHPETNERCDVSFWGGFICSEGCEGRVDRDMKQSIDDHVNSIFRS